MPEIRKVILLLATSRAHVRGLLHGIARYSRVHGPWIFYTDASLYGKRDALSWLKECGADGVIAPDAKENREIIGMGLPTIVYRVAEKRIPHLPAIVADNATIGKMAAEHLLNRGLSCFAYCGFESRPWSRQRKESFAGRIAEAGFKADIFYTNSESGSWRSFERGQNRQIEWLKSLPKPVGVMAGNDVCGRHVIEACRIAGLQVPDQVAVIGVDNDELICDLTDPPMSSIALNTEKAGYEAAELLDRLIAGENTAARDILVRATHITTRQSTDILAAEDRTVAEAIRFIRHHSKEAIQVSNVVDHVAVSRRNLEQRFRRVLGRSIYNEIKRVRTQQIIRMLCETDLSVSEIALRLGHPSDKHIARYFKQQTGMSLKEYRRQCRK
ncbi:MAG: XylR family transcriptional regulator [Planctomycetota bacterium]|jgi:LacI family transcriptional regulator